MNKDIRKTLYNEAFEHDACGIGAVVSIDGVASHSIVDDALSIVEKLEHRAGKDATGETGDGVGILVQISHGFLAVLFRGSVRRVITVWECFSSRRNRLNAVRRRKCLKLSAQKRVWSSSRGEMFRPTAEFSVSVQKVQCRI